MGKVSKAAVSTAMLGAALCLLSAPLAASDAVRGGDSGVPGRAGGPPAAPEQPGEEGELRLVSEVSVNGFVTGALQLYHGGVWSAVCGDEFDITDAGVACRQLGYSGGASLDTVFLPFSFGVDSAAQEALLEEVRAPFALGHLGCNGTEARLVDCSASEDADYDYSFRYGFSYDYGREPGCDPTKGSSYAFVACGTDSGPVEGDLRLEDGATAEDGSAQYGRLEVYAKGGWGTVCSSAFGDNPIGRSFVFDPRGPAVTFSAEDATVACKQLGFTEGFVGQSAQTVDSAVLGRVPICIGSPGCSGVEGSLLSCPGSTIGSGVEDCSHDNDVYLVCSGGPDPEKDGSVRLEDGSSGVGYQYGRLEVFLRGFWSDVCATERFTPAAAAVACRQLGFSGGAALRFPAAYEGTLEPVLDAALPVALAAVDCDGTEASLLECQSDDARIPRCSETTDGTVLACGDSAPGCDKIPVPEEGAVRLVDGFGSPCDPLHTGAVEVYHAGEWGAICIDSGDLGDTLAADVICRQLGFPHGTPVDPFNPDDPADAPAPAVYYGFGYNYYDDDVEESAMPGGRFWLSEVRCNGPEATLNGCNLGLGYRTANRGCQKSLRTGVARMAVACRQFAVEGAGEAVTTPGAEEGDVRLVEQQEIANWVTGGLEVFFEGSWSRVCSAGFGAADAAVACRQLGYAAGSAADGQLSSAEAADVLRARNGTAVAEAAITLSGCTGEEASLLDCPAGAETDVSFSRSIRDCASQAVVGLRLACVAEEQTGTEGAIRLTEQEVLDEGESVAGVLEVFHAGAWGTVCEGTSSDPFSVIDYSTAPITESAAVIACQELGYKRGVLQPYGPTRPAAAAPALPSWLPGLPCVGFEQSLAECDLPEFGDTGQCGPAQRLTCSNAGGSTGDVRLVGGSTDPGGEWAYGLLEVLLDGIWQKVPETLSEALGRRGAQVACRTLGFDAGVQLLAGASSPLTSPEFEPEYIRKIACDGDEATLADCDIILESIDSGFFGGDGASVHNGDVAVLCSQPSSCAAVEEAPTEGSVRLVPLNGTAAATAACDTVHTGGVEIYHDGEWGRVCTGRRTSRVAEFTLAAEVVCKQLGFPFGGLIDAGEATDADYSDIADYADYFDYTVTRPTVWATQVACTGKEATLAECAFPQNFGESPFSAAFPYGAPYGALYEVAYGYYAFAPYAGPGDIHGEGAEEVAQPPYDGVYDHGHAYIQHEDIQHEGHIRAAGGPVSAPSPSAAEGEGAVIFGEGVSIFDGGAVPRAGVSRSSGCSRKDGLLLAVACRRFEIAESDVIRR